MTELELSKSFSIFSLRVVPSSMTASMIVSAEIIMAAVFFLLLTERFPGVPGGTSGYLCPLDVAD